MSDSPYTPTDDELSAETVEDLDPGDGDVDGDDVRGGTADAGKPVSSKAPC